MIKEFDLLYCYFPSRSEHKVAIAPYCSGIEVGDEVSITYFNESTYGEVIWVKSVSTMYSYTNDVIDLALSIDNSSDVEEISRVRAFRRTKIISSNTGWEEEDDTEGNCSEAFEEA